MYSDRAGETIVEWTEKEVTVRLAIQPSEALAFASRKGCK